MTKERYIRETKIFLSDIRTKIPEDHPTILINEPNTKDFKECIDDLTRDSIFSEAEIELIRSQIDKPLLRKWTNRFIDKTNFISRDTVISIFKDTSRGWMYFYNTYGSGFSSYSAPIFLRDNALCLFYSQRSCGGLCGGGSLVVFQKENGAWKPLKFYCMWVS